MPCDRTAHLTLSLLLLETFGSLFVQPTMQPRVFPALLFPKHADFPEYPVIMR